jgi:hypothetical protein
MVFLYVSSAEDTIRRPFCQDLTHDLAVRYSSHYGIRADQSGEALLRELRTRVTVSDGYIVVCADTGSDSFEGSLAPVLRAFADADRREMFQGLKRCEVLAYADDLASADALISKCEASRLQLSPEKRECLHVYVVLPTDGPSGQGPSGAVVASLLTAIVTPSQSRMYPYDGLSALRTATPPLPRALKETRMPTPYLGGLAERALGKALLERVFSARSQPSEVSFPRILRLMDQHGALSDGESKSGLNARLRWAALRDTLLVPLCSLMIAAVPSQSEFLAWLDQTADMSRSHLFAQLLRDLRNEITALSAATAVETAQGGPGWPEAQSVAELEADVLTRGHGFALWPLLPEALRPREIALANAYSGALDRVKKAAANSVYQSLKRAEDEERAALRRAAAPYRDTWRNIRSFVVVHPSLTMDQNDELWDREHDAAIVVALERKLL